MTVSTEVSREEYTGNGVTTDFDYRFRVFSADELVVTVADTTENIRTLVLNTDYTVTGAGSRNGGKVKLASALANNWRISIERELPVTQETDVRNQGNFFPEVHEDAWDKLTMLIQQAIGGLGLALRKPNWLAKYYDAKGNRISNLSDPVYGQDAATKRYVDAGDASSNQHADDLFKRTIRVPENYVDELPTIHGRGGKLFAWSNSGRPIAVHAETDGGTQLEIDLAGSDGFKFIGQAGSFDELRSVIPERAGQKILLGGYYPGWAAIGQPAGGGEFVAVSGVAVDDGGYICQPTGSALFHWQRVIDGRMLSPEMFGAFPDSTRSVRGTDYAANLNKMFAAAIANNFGVDFRHGQGGYEFEKERAYYVGSPVVATGIHQIRGSVYLHADSSLFDKTNNSYVLLLGDPKTNYQTIQNTLLFDFIFVRDIDQRGLRSGLKNELNGVFLKYTGVYGDGFRAMDFNGRGVHCSPVFDSKFGIIQERCGNELSYAITVDGNGDESNSITFTYILSHDAYHKGVYITGSKHNILRAHIEATAVTTLDDGYTGASGSVAQSGLKYLNNFFYLVAGQTGNITINDYSRSDNKTYYDDLDNYASTNGAHSLFILNTGSNASSIQATSPNVHTSFFGGSTYGGIGVLQTINAYYETGSRITTSVARVTDLRVFDNFNRFLSGRAARVSRAAGQFYSFTVDAPFSQSPNQEGTVVFTNCTFSGGISALTNGYTYLNNCIINGISLNANNTPERGIFRGCNISGNINIADASSSTNNKRVLFYACEMTGNLTLSSNRESTPAFMGSDNWARGGTVSGWSLPKHMEVGAIVQRIGQPSAGQGIIYIATALLSDGTNTWATIAQVPNA